MSQLTEFVLAPLLFWPNGIDKCRLECWTIAPDWGDGEGPDYWTVNNGERLCDILLEDTEFGTQIQRSMESPGFKGVPLSYQEARIYHWNQNADQMRLGQDPRRASGSTGDRGRMGTPQRPSRYRDD